MSESSVAARASRVRARLLFLLLDAISVCAGYGLAEIIYFRHRPPADYWHHFALFLAVAVVVVLTANHRFGLYERMWRHAGAQEASQLCFAAIITMAILLVFDLVWRMYRPELVPLSVVVVGCLFSTIGMGIIRFHSRLFAWQRGSRQMGLRVAIVGSFDMGAAAIREMQSCPSAGFIPVSSVRRRHSRSRSFSSRCACRRQDRRHSGRHEPLHASAGAVGHPVPGA